jgi:hypothetical protein
MGGTGGGGFFGGPIDPSKLKKEIEQALGETERQKREVAIDAAITGLLAAFNSRDYDKTSKRLDELQVALGEEIDGMETLLFGGSVAKRTYVDGLSDVDAVVVIDKEEVETTTPDAMLADFASAVRKYLAHSGVVAVTAGSMAVTAEYSDGMVIQLLPAARTRTGLLISDGKSGWRLIKPREFTEALTRQNKQLTQMLVPTIKLAKSAMSRLADDIRPTGYHVEALALRVFSEYRGEHRPTMMLPHFFREAVKAVLRPMVDVTGQSRHLDANLGPSGSEARRRLSATCERLARRLEGARSAEEWRDVLDPDD